MVSDNLNKHNPVIDRMMDDALEEVVKKGWRRASQKSVTMACYKMMKDELRGQRAHVGGMVKPIWWLACVLGAGIAWQIVSSLIFR